ncbi:hypothetical protein QE152_g14012 [Popillia japonica]|uniref:Secreted protein n=1 Tax=Popillia japonica TaxID=7064 RepID=A0AAW1LAU1_POPJA
MMSFMLQMLTPNFMLLPIFFHITLIMPSHCVVNCFRPEVNIGSLVKLRHPVKLFRICSFFRNPIRNSKNWITREVKTSSQALQDLFVLQKSYPELKELS